MAETGWTMARDDRTEPLPAGIREPQISLIGSVDECMAEHFRKALANPPEGDEPITVDMTTLGGDPEMARRMILELDSARERLKPRRIVFHGKSVVYSAGATFMAGVPRKDRYLAEDAMLLIHCRQLDKTIELQGPLRGSVPKIEALLHQLESGIELEEDNFERLIEGSDIEMAELLDKALYNWYLPATVALERRLIAGIVNP